ncbi:nucleotide-diphospho-sugar transferase [Gonapodya prolifera JEL478]|uniref:UDP-N-acetylglucosamine diphosphorylase n=1 Tax=Gonapodya prolifera (strain JEL478) TaxID=1344416 RepID=A0A139AVY9_GONPJ|nr:nucleotide-diphospho-sugar transferase [Gonapodya prolifera JEL478]|eukprot:KXS20635.1 nucleotide-diphospho-sugar transferase [Gonapodya prolifera JEL478]
MSASTPTLDSIEASLGSKQSHVLTFYASLPPAEQAAFLHELASIDIDRCNTIFAKATQTPPAATAHEADLKPLPDAMVDSTIGADEAKVAKWWDTGMESIAKGECAVVLMAGGQGTRLGSSAPKGCYDISLPSHKSLFQLQAERILRLQNLASRLHGKPVVIPWYVMTSGPTRKDTEDFFKANGNWGLPAENVIVFEQGVLPAFYPDGRLLLATKGSLSLSPDGNGGIYAALRTQKVLDDMRKRGVKYVHLYGVDNCLVRVADPVFFGYCIAKGADCGAKVVRKSSPTEAAGVLAVKDGKINVVEYSEISKEMAASVHPKTGQLLFGAANIANHFYTTAFLEKVQTYEKELEYHIAHKKVKTVDLATGTGVAPTTPNAIKLELFVFDVFPHAQNFAVLEVDRKEEFSPLKNAPNTGTDDPQTSRRDILAQHRRFLEAAGATVEAAAEVELSPVVTYSGEGLKEVVKGKKVHASGAIYVASDTDLKNLVA